MESLNDLEGDHKVQLWLRQHGKRKSVTVQGLDDDLDLERIARHVRRNLKVSAAVIEDKKSAAEAVEANREYRASRDALSLENMCLVQRRRKCHSNDGSEDYGGRNKMMYLPSHQALLVAGDKRRELVDFLVDNEIVLDRSRIVMHGYVA